MTDQTWTSRPEVDPDVHLRVITLAEAARLEPAAARALLGTKAANLALLLGAGFPVPAGVVATAAAATDWDDAYVRLRTLPLVSRYLADQMAAGRLRQMDPDLAFQALVGPIVLHVLWRPAAGSRTDGPPVGGAPLEEAVDELVGVWLRAMATDLPTGPQPAACGRTRR